MRDVLQHVRRDAVALAAQVLDEALHALEDDVRHAQRRPGCLAPPRRNGARLLPRTFRDLAAAVIIIVTVLILVLVLVLVLALVLVVVVVVVVLVVVGRSRSEASAVPLLALGAQRHPATSTA